MQQIMYKIHTQKNLTLMKERSIVFQIIKLNQWEHGLVSIFVPLFFYRLLECPCQVPLLPLINRHQSSSMKTADFQPKFFHPQLSLILHTKKAVEFLPAEGLIAGIVVPLQSKRERNCPKDSLLHPTLAVRSLSLRLWVNERLASVSADQHTWVT